MFAKLSRRLTGWYVLVSVGVLFVVVGVSTVLAFTMFAHGTNDSISLVARELHDLEPRYAARHARIASVAPAVIARLQRPRLHLIAFDEFQPRRGAPGMRYLVRVEKSRPGPPEGPPPPGTTRGVFGAGPHDSPVSRIAFGFATLIGVHPVRVPFLNGTMLIGPDVDHLENIFATYFAAIVPLGLLAAVLAYFTGRAITSAALRPLYEVTEALQAFGAGDFTPREIPAARGSDFRALAHAYNDAAQQVASAFAQRAQAERHMRQFVADAGHELRTPLTVVVGFIDVLRRRMPPESESTQKIFRTIGIESTRMRVLIDNLILLAKLDREPETRAQPVDVSAVAEHVVETRRPLAAGTPIAFTAAPDSIVVADEHELYEALGNLVDNALKYAPNAPVEVRVRVADGEVVVSVADHGPGLDGDEAAHAFDRFYRGDTRGEIEGSGLGLAIAKRAVERANGRIEVRSSPGNGATFEIVLPRCTSAPLPLPVG